MKKLFAGLTVAMASAIPLVASASAPTYDVSAATAAITDGGTAVATIGVAALVMVVGIKVWKRLRGAA